MPTATHHIDPNQQNESETLATEGKAMAWDGDAGAPKSKDGLHSTSNVVVLR